MRTALLLDRKKAFTLLFFTLMFGSATVSGQAKDQLKWEHLNPLPVNDLAGMYAGVSNNVLIFAGGARIANENSSSNLSGQYHDAIFILENKKSQWKAAQVKLPTPLAFGVAVNYQQMMILVGGSNGNRHVADVRTITYRNGNILIDTLVSLPVPLSGMSGAIVGNILFVSGGSSGPSDPAGKFFFALDLSKGRNAQQWIQLEAWPGAARKFSVSASLSNKLFLFGGVTGDQDTANSKHTYLLDSYSFTPTFTGNNLTGGKWIALSASPAIVATAPSPAPTMGANHIFLLENTMIGSNASQKAKLLAYHISSNTWTSFGIVPGEDLRQYSSAVKWKGQWVLGGGNGKVRNTHGMYVLERNIGFGWLNWVALIVYLLFMIWIGFIFDKKREQTTKNFFTAGGRIPWWAAGLSIFGTQLSAITFMATPALVFATNWTLAAGTIVILLTVPIVVKYYIPFFRGLSVTSAYEYLEYRFSATVRILGSISFILFQLGRMGIVLYLPAIAIASVTGIHIFLIIAIMGVVCILYTVMGGIEAVIWTDVLQVIILMGGAILCLVLAITNVDGGLGGVISKGMEAEKFKLVLDGWSANEQVLWVVVIGFFFLNIIPYTSDQTIVQRYLTVKNEKAAAKSLWTNAIMSLPTVPIFFGLGTALYIFYTSNVDAIPSEQVGEVLPYFVVQQLPAGIAGVVMAGIFAASQSTLSASMNSISAAYLSDIHPRFKKSTTDRQNLSMAKLITVAVGLFGVGSAILVVVLNASFIFELFMEILGIMGGALAGIFILGIFTTRANATGVVIGMISGVIVVWCTKLYTDVNVYLYGAISVATTFCVGYVVSIFVGGARRVRGLTYFTTEKEEDLKAV